MDAIEDFAKGDFDIKWMHYYWENNMLSDKCLTPKTTQKVEE